LIQERPDQLSSSAENPAREAPSRRAGPSEFLRLLYPGGVPERHRIVLWTRPGDTADSDPIADPAQADHHCGARDMYFHACLCPASMHGTRLCASDARGLAGVWLDIDVVGGPDVRRKPPAPSRDAAFALSTAYLTPTAIVDSGYGIHAWWLFEEPWIFSGVLEQRQAARVSEGWSRLHQRRAVERAFTVDSCFDLARLMRLPGTLNAKDPKRPVPVTLLAHDGPRHPFEAIARLAVLAAPLPDSRAVRPTVNTGSPFPTAKFRSLLARSERFNDSWAHQRPDLKDQSLSGYDMALVRLAAAAGWTDDDLSALIREHRLAQGDRSSKGRYASYVARTIARAREGSPIAVRPDALSDKRPTVV
jgi:hypothetical protein